MNILKVDFQELYERHLCRHSQMGINIAHLGSVATTYYGAFLLIAQVVAWLDGPWWALPVGLVPYLVVLALNLPPRLLAATVVFYVLFLPLVLVVPPLPWWLVCPLSVVLIALGHKSQQWSHRYWDEEIDMTDFNKKYKKGRKLFLLLSVYELPILLNYLVFVGRGATRPAASHPAEPVQAVPDEVRSGS
jgi:hypothetical protein